jgi:rod shape determining protein RodA
MVSGIALFGAIVLYSAAGGSLQPWAIKQAAIFLFFLAVAIGMSWISEATIKALIFPVYAVIVVMLVGVEILGFTAKGAQRWLDIGPIRLQPSEFMKPAIALTLARFYELVPAGEIKRWRAIWPALVILGVPAALILLQPDLGTCIMVVLCGVTVMFVAGIPLWVFLGPATVVAVAAPIVYSSLHGYQRKRIDTFLDPDSDPLGTGYHIAQSKIAIGSGGVWGKGFLKGSQSHLDYLPEGHTDFAFASLAEEWGLVGGIVLILAFAAVIRWGMKVSINAKSRFAQLAAAGLTACIFFYASINLMMVMGLAPVVGVPLPLISYGGSAVMTVMLCFGLLMALERQQRTTGNALG